MAKIREQRTCSCQAGLSPEALEDVRKNCGAPAGHTHVTRDQTSRMAAHDRLKQRASASFKELYKTAVHRQMQKPKGWVGLCKHQTSAMQGLYAGWPAPYSAWLHTCFVHGKLFT